MNGPSTTAPRMAKFAIVQEHANITLKRLTDLADIMEATVGRIIGHEERPEAPEAVNAKLPVERPRLDELEYTQEQSLVQLNRLEYTLARLRHELPELGPGPDLGPIGRAVR